MRRETIDRLVAVNQQMYMRSATAFSATRDHPWRGWERLFSHFRGPSSVLDLGCGNGRFLAALEAKGLVRDFVGVDTSAPLLAIARSRFPSRRFVLCDATTFEAKETFDWVVAFGLIHHVPGREERNALMRRLGRDATSACVTFWQFESHARFARRMRSFESIGVGEGEVESGDHLLAFGEDGLRYCHHAGDEEIDELIASSKMQSVDRYTADGETGDLNLYAVLGRPDRSADR